jgi:peptidyl-prolyl cis-trans isomerase C
MNHRTSLPKILFIAVITHLLAGCGGKDEAKPADTAPKEVEKKESDLPSGLTPEQAAKVVAKVGDRTITVGEITRQINRLSPYIRRRWAAPEKRKEFLENLINVELLSQEAERLGLGKDNPEVTRTVNQVMIRMMMKNELEHELVPSKIEDSVLRQEYDKEKDKYQRPPQVRASQIVVKTKAEADKLLAELKEKPNDNRLFRERARDHSLDEVTKHRGGDIGYFSKTGGREGEPEVDPKIREAVWKLDKTGAMAEAPIQTKAGFHIVKLTNKRPELNRTFDSVKKMIEGRLIREKRKEALDKFIADLKARAKIEIFENNLAKLELPETPPQMMGPDSPGPPGMQPPMPGRASVKKTKPASKVSGEGAKKVE